MGRAWVLTGLVVLALVGAPGTPGAAAASSATGVISGSVQSAISGQPLAGVCVYAYPITGGERGSWTTTGPAYQTSTDDGGGYQLAVSLYNYYAILFDPSCAGTLQTDYALQYYSYQLDLADAYEVSAPSTGTDAQLAAGFSLSGDVTAETGSTGVGGTCVSAIDAAGHPVSTATTNSDGTYTIAALPAGTYAVYFDPTCGGTKQSPYAAQYYDGSADLQEATPVQLNATTSGIDAQLLAGASISGTLKAPGALDAGGICVHAASPDGTVAGRAVTTTTGAYLLSNLAPSTYSLQLDPTCDRTQVSYYAPLNGPVVSLAAGQLKLAPSTTLSLNEVSALLITQAHLHPGVAGSNYFASIAYQGPSAEGGDYHWSVAGLPQSFHLSVNSAVLPVALVGHFLHAGAYTVTLTVTTLGAVPPLVSKRTFVLQVKSPPPPTPRVIVASSAAKVTPKYLTVTLSCRAAAGAGRAKALSAKANSVVLASGPYSLRAGKTAHVKLPLTSAGKKAFATAKAHSVKAELSLTARRGKDVTKVLQVS